MGGEYKRSGYTVCRLNTPVVPLPDYLHLDTPHHCNVLLPQILPEAGTGVQNYSWRYDQERERIFRLACVQGEESE